MSKQMTNNHIPESVIQKCAEKAFEVTSFHYEPECIAVCLDWAPHYIQKNVRRDVLAVLLGNRTAKDLHESWADRKFRECGSSSQRLKRKYPTAMLSFDFLPADDRRGYELFVETVRNTHKQMTEGLAKEEQKVNLSLTDRIEDNCTLLKILRDKYTGCTISENQVLISFKTRESAQQFIDTLVRTRVSF